MKKLLLFLFLLALPFINHAAPLGPDGAPHTITQPDGSKIELRMYGDEYYAYERTLNHYTVIRPEGQKNYYYAKLNESQDALISTGILVTPDDANAPVESLNANLPAAKIKSIVEARMSENVMPASVYATRMATRVSGAKNVMAEKTYSGVTLYVSFSDNDKSKVPTREAVIALMNAENLKETYPDSRNTGSVYEYFYDQSFGQVKYKNYVTPRIDLPNPRNYYIYSDYPTNTTAYAFNEAVLKVVTDALAIYRPMNDPNWNTEDLNLSPTGFIDLNILYPGDIGGSVNTESVKGLWPHHSTFFDTQTIKPGVYAYNYQISNIENSNDFPIGTIVHENGHLLFLFKDIYDQQYKSKGVGRYCLMGSGNSNDYGYTPSPINMFYKLRQGWVTPIDIDANTNGTFSITPNEAKVYRYNNPSPTDQGGGYQRPEYFLIEPRSTQFSKWNATSTLINGLLIWHIDECYLEQGNYYAAPNTFESHGLIHVEQPDGRFDLENNMNDGDNGDIFNGTNYTTFSDDGTCNSKWWDGRKSGFLIYDIKAPTEEDGTIVFSLGTPPEGKIALTEQPTEVILGQETTLRWTSTYTTQIVKIELFNARGKIADLSTNTSIGNKSFAWTPTNFDPRPDYYIRITEISNPANYAETGKFELLKEYYISPNKKLSEITSELYTNFTINVPDEGLMKDFNFRVNISSGSPLRYASHIFLAPPGSSYNEETRTKTGKVIGMQQGLSLEGTGFLPAYGNNITGYNNLIFDEEATEIADRYQTYAAQYINPNISDNCHKMSSAYGGDANGDWIIYIHASTLDPDIQLNSFGLRIQFERPTVSVAGFNEGNMGENLNITFTLDQASDKEIHVPFKLAGSAIEGTHFNITGSNVVNIDALGNTINTQSEWKSVTIPANVTTATVTLALPQNATRIGDKNLTLTLDYNSEMYRDPTLNTQKITIKDTLELPVASFASNGQSLNYQAETIQIPVNLSTATQEGATIQYSVSGTAVKGEDYQLENGMLTFRNSETTKTIPVQLLANNKTTASTLIITLETASSCTLGTSAVYTITLNPSSTTEYLDETEIIVTGNEAGTSMPNKNGITLTWTTVEGKEYRILRQMENGTSFEPKSIWQTEGSFNDTDTIPGKRYYYKIEVRNL